MLKVVGKGENGKYTPEELSQISLEDVKKMIVTQVPDAFAKKAATKKTATKKVATKKIIHHFKIEPHDKNSQAYNTLSCRYNWAFCFMHTGTDKSKNHHYCER